MDNDPLLESKYRTVHVAARRARQLQSGAIPMVDASSTKACKVAQDELRAGKVDYVIPVDFAPRELDLPTGYTPILHS